MNRSCDSSGGLAVDWCQRAFTLWGKRRARPTTEEGYARQNDEEILHVPILLTLPVWVGHDSIAWDNHAAELRASGPAPGIGGRRADPVACEAPQRVPLAAR